MTNPLCRSGSDRDVLVKSCRMLTEMQRADKHFVTQLEHCFPSGNGRRPYTPVAVRPAVGLSFSAGVP